VAKPAANIHFILERRALNGIIAVLWLISSGQRSGPELNCQLREAEGFKTIIAVLWLLYRMDAFSATYYLTLFSD
jgi:hypothetical protein